MMDFVPLVRSALAMSIVIGAVAAQESPCEGCQLGIVTYRDGLFLGPQPIPGVTVVWTPDPVSSHGACDGESPTCEGAPCQLGTGKIEIIVTAGTADDYYPNGSGDDSLHRAELTAGNSAKFMVGFKQPIQLACQTYVFTRLMDVVTNKGTPQEDAWVVEAHCTTCQ
jgi:hypothetical protein